MFNLIKFLFGWVNSAFEPTRVRILCNLQFAIGKSQFLTLPIFSMAHRGSSILPCSPNYGSTNPKWSDYRTPRSISVELKIERPRVCRPAELPTEISIDLWEIT